MTARRSGRRSRRQALLAISFLLVASQSSCSATSNSDKHPIVLDTGADELGVQMEVGRDAACAIVEGTIDCWFGDWGIPEGVPTGQYDAMSVGFYVACAHEVGGEWVCWGDDVYGIFDAAPGGWSAAPVLSVGQRHACALDAEGRPTCWGEQAFDPESLSPPDVRLVSVVAAIGPSCGLDTDGALVCWGELGESSLTAGEAPFSQSLRGLTGRGTHLCALDAATSVPICWGEQWEGEITAVTGEPVAAITAGSSATTCWINLDGSSQCVGRLTARRYGPVDDSAFWPEEGAAVSIGVSADGPCVLTDAGTIECWSGAEGWP